MPTDIPATNNAMWGFWGTMKSYLSRSKGITIDGVDFPHWQDALQQLWEQCVKNMIEHSGYTAQAAAHELDTSSGRHAADALCHGAGNNAGSVIGDFEGEPIYRYDFDTTAKAL